MELKAYLCAASDGKCFQCGENCMKCGCWLKGLDMSLIDDFQPERLNPETPNKRCDSLNTANK